MMALPQESARDLPPALGVRTGAVSKDKQETRLIVTILQHPVTHVTGALALLSVMFFVCLEYQKSFAGTINFAMDDAWIHVTVARNFAQGDGWGIVPGKTLSVSTSPTWTLLLAPFFLFFENPIRIGLTASFLCMALATVLCYFLAARLTGRAWLGLLASYLTIMNPISLWGLASGLELPLALASLLMVFYCHYGFEVTSRVRLYASPLALAFAAVTRPELFVLIPLALLDNWLVLSRHHDERISHKAAQIVLGQLLMVGVALAPYFLLNLASHGKIFPTTYYAKTIVRGVGLGAALQSGDAAIIWNSLVREPLAQCLEITSDLVRQNLPVFLLAAAGALGFCGTMTTAATARGLLLPVTFFVLPWVMGMTSPAKHFANHADRYFVIFPPMAALLACVALRTLALQGRMRWGVVVMALLVLCGPIRTTGPVLRHIGIDAESSQRLYVEMPLWLRDNLEPGATLATNDIGGVAYFTKRDVIDVMGLASPEIWPALQRGAGKPQDLRKLKSYLRDQKVDYVLLSPRYYPSLTADKETFEPMREWREGYEHGRLISPQILYRTHWRD